MAECAKGSRRRPRRESGTGSWHPWGESSGCPFCFPSCRWFCQPRLGRTHLLRHSAPDGCHPWFRRLPSDHPPPEPRPSVGGGGCTGREGGSHGVLDRGPTFDVVRHRTRDGAPRFGLISRDQLRGDVCTGRIPWVSIRCYSGRTPRPPASCGYPGARPRRCDTLHRSLLQCATPGTPGRAHRRRGASAGNHRRRGPCILRGVQRRWRELPAGHRDAARRLGTFTAGGTRAAQRRANTQGAVES